LKYLYYSSSIINIQQNLIIPRDFLRTEQNFSNICDDWACCLFMYRFWMYYLKIKTEDWMYTTSLCRQSYQINAKVLF